MTSNSDEVNVCYNSGKLPTSVVSVKVDDAPVIKKLESHSGDMLTSMALLKSDDSFCDVTIKSGALRIRAHRNVLASATDYFKGMFLNQTKEAETGVVDFSKMSPEVMQQCVEFIYSGQLEIAAKTVRELLDASEMMHLPGLAKLCVDFLAERVDMKSCAEVITLSCIYNKNSLNSPIERFLLDNFEEFSQTDDFLSLNCDSIEYCLELLGRDGKDREFEKWKSILRWTNNEIEGRRRHFPKLFRTIDFSCFARLFIEKEIYAESLVFDSTECLQTVVKVIFDENKLADAGKNYDILTYIAAFNRESRLIHQYNVKADKWSILTRFPWSFPQNVDMILYRGSVYIGDGYKFYIFSNGCWTTACENNPSLPESVPNQLLSVKGHARSSQEPQSFGMTEKDISQGVELSKFTDAKKSAGEPIDKDMNDSSVVFESCLPPTTLARETMSCISTNTSSTSLFNPQSQCTSGKPGSLGTSPSNTGFSWASAFGSIQKSTCNIKSCGGSDAKMFSSCFAKPALTTASSRPVFRSLGSQNASTVSKQRKGKFSHKPPSSSPRGFKFDTTSLSSGWVSGSSQKPIISSPKALVYASVPSQLTSRTAATSIRTTAPSYNGAKSVYNRCFAVGNEIFMITSTCVNKYHLKLSKWTSRVLFNGLGKGFFVAISHHKIYLMGGKGSEKCVREYDLNSTQLEKISSMMLPKICGHAFWYDEKVYAFGGTYPADVECYDPEIDRWFIIPHLKIGRHPAQVFIGEKLYVVGGDDAENEFETIELEKLKLPAEKRRANVDMSSCCPSAF